LAKKPLATKLPQIKYYCPTVFLFAGNCLFNHKPFCATLLLINI